MKVLIYQVLGRLEGYSGVNYEVNGSLVEGIKLSSEALHHFYEDRGDKPHIIYVCPNSIYEKEDILELFTDENSLMEISRSKISNIVQKDFSILVVNAIGNYKIGDKTVSFKNTPSNVTAQAFFDMLERIENNYEETKVVADISTGLNVYIVSMLEALRAITVYDKLRNGITGAKVCARYAISEPIIGSNGGQSHTRRIFINEYDVKAFFTLPIKPKSLDKLSKLEQYIENNHESKRKISGETKDERKRLKSLLENFVKAFNSIRYNAPLAFYSRLIDLSQDPTIKKELVNFFREQIKPVSRDNVVVATGLKLKDVLNLFYSLALFEWISNEMGELKGGDNASITEIEARFTKIYSRLGLLLNKRFLERDLDEIEDKKNEISEEWECLKNLFSEDGRNRAISASEDQGKMKGSDQKRNFFAHSGLERTLVEVRRRKHDGEIELKYKEEKLKEIDAWLSDPEDSHVEPEGCKED